MIRHDKFCRNFILRALLLGLCGSAMLAAAQTATACPSATAIISNFNGTSIQQGNFIWFNANFAAAGIPVKGATIYFSNLTISFNAGGVQHTLPVPNAAVSFVPTASCGTTSFDPNTDTWYTRVPLSGSDEIFLTGMAYQLPSTITNVGPVMWSGTVSATAPGISLNWKWGAAVYTRFTEYSNLEIKAVHQNDCRYKNGDHAGVPENFTAYVVGGARGGGGSNFTGSWSSTQAVKVSVGTPPPQLPPPTM